ncbi:MAG: ATP-binding protein, partial [Nanoarchaeota archaeon]|nr:ATP-binding protein [Nanoarchaeota archaeon]
MNLDILTEQNIWWKDKGLIEQDYDIIRWKEKKYRWIPPIIERIKLEPFSLNIILGPRQVGKTTAIKLLIKNLLREKNPLSIFYFNCEELSDYKELLDILETYIEFKKSSEIKNSYIFLDEITSPLKWYKAIKSKVDKGVFNEDVLVLTGSSSINIKRQTELFPGRRGKGLDYMILPLSFREFLKVTKPKIY